ncbi:GreA/GreB family elongation factor [Belliella pelovolcani]|uniref:GreA/GreB family elongation factor n=1 Tax=Belliella pelovolcani TaxID=529505 RepID=UPI00391A2341
MVPIIKKSDEKVLSALMESIPLSKRTKELGILQSELRRAKIVADNKVSEKVIKLDSSFEIIDIASGKKLQFTLTFPKNANLAEQRLSILSPLGVALIGFQEGKVIEWNLPAGTRKFKIEKLSQSESILSA